MTELRKSPKLLNRTPRKKKPNRRKRLERPKWQPPKPRLRLKRCKPSKKSRSRRMSNRHSRLLQHRLPQPMQMPLQLLAKTRLPTRQSWLQQRPRLMPKSKQQRARLMPRKSPPRPRLQMLRMLPSQEETIKMCKNCSRILSSR